MGWPTSHNQILGGNTGSESVPIEAYPLCFGALNTGADAAYSSSTLSILATGSLKTCSGISVGREEVVEVVPGHI
jgi:hypothetical protein